MDDVEVYLLGDVQPAGLFDLQKFPFAHEANGFGGDFQQVIGFSVHRHEQAAREQIIPHEHRDFFLPQGLNRKEAAAQGTFIDHIVVDQGGGVQQFDQGSGDVAALPEVLLSTGYGLCR